MKLNLKIFNEHERDVPLQKIHSLAEKVWNTEAKKRGRLNIILVDNNQIKKLNRQFLNRNTSTDVISFPIEDEDDVFDGEIYICLDRVAENARIYNVDFVEELQRNVVHGILHFFGYSDKSPPERAKMTDRENFYLSN